MINNQSGVIVFGGWGVTPDILSGCFGTDAAYIDCNNLMGSIICNGQLVSGWVNILIDTVHIDKNKTCALAGWSTGAIIALAIASEIEVDTLTLMSPTLSFCRRDSYRSGMRQSVMSSMRETLRSNPHTVLSPFYQSCGIDTPPPEPLPWTPSALIDGLYFLEQVDCRSLRCLARSVCLIHSLQDSVIPFSAGEQVAQALGTSLHSFEGGHAFFTHYQSEIKTFIDTYKYKDTQ